MTACVWNSGRGKTDSQCWEAEGVIPGCFKRKLVDRKNKGPFTVIKSTHSTHMYAFDTPVKTKPFLGSKLKC